MLNVVVFPGERSFRALAARFSAVSRAVCGTLFSFENVVDSAIVPAEIFFPSEVAGYGAGHTAVSLGW